MEKDELRLVFSWAEKEGWNPGKYEINAFYNLDKNGFFILLLEEKPIASLACVKYEKNHYFMGLYLVLPEYRHQGFGQILWNFVVKQLNINCTVALNSVISQIKTYEKCGFSSLLSCKVNTRWSGVVSTILSNKKNNISPNNLNIISSTDALLKSIIEYDQKITTVKRSRFLLDWLTMKESILLCAIEDKRIKGFGLINRCSNGYKIAPLVADNPDIAQHLFLSLCQEVNTEDTVFFDSNQGNRLSCQIAKDYKMTHIFDSLRMYKGIPPDLDNDKIFFLTSLEIGW